MRIIFLERSLVCINARREKHSKFVCLDTKASKWACLGCIFMPLTKKATLITQLGGTFPPEHTPTSPSPTSQEHLQDKPPAPPLWSGPAPGKPWQAESAWVGVSGKGPEKVGHSPEKFGRGLGRGMKRVRAYMGASALGTGLAQLGKQRVGGCLGKRWGLGVPRKGEGPQRLPLASSPPVNSGLPEALAGIPPRSFWLPARLAFQQELGPVEKCNPRFCVQVSQNQRHLLNT